MNPCVVVGCVKPRKYKDFCNMHYLRVRAGEGVGPAHSKKNAGKYVGDQIIYRAIVERVLGKPLPRRTVIHHVNEDRSDNRNDNLVVCPSQSYHVLLHQRQRALDECGHADWLRCSYCKQYDATTNMRVRLNRRQASHRHCEAKYARDRRHAQV